MSSWFPKWRPYEGSIDARPVGTAEYLPPAQTVILGVQHAFAMFGATVLAPFLMGFDPNLAILMSGICTILFFLITGGRVPSYLGSSFAFIGVVIAATGYAGGGGLNPNIGVAAGGIIACGIFYALMGFLVMATGTRWIEKLMPPVVTGAVVMIIGLNLAPVTVEKRDGQYLQYVDVPGHCAVHGFNCRIHPWLITAPAVIGWPVIGLSDLFCTQ